MRKSMCLLGKLYQWAMNANENNQVGSHHRTILKQTVHLLYIHYPVSISNIQYYILKRHCFCYYTGVRPEFC